MNRGALGVRPRKNNNQSNERQVRGGQLRGGGGTCAAVCPGQEGRGQADPPTAFNSPSTVPLGPPYHNVTTRDSLALLLKVKIPLAAERSCGESILSVLSVHLSSSSSSSFLPSFFENLPAYKLVARNFLRQILSVTETLLSVLAFLFNCTLFFPTTIIVEIVRCSYRPNGTKKRNKEEEQRRNKPGRRFSSGI